MAKHTMMRPHQGPKGPSGSIRSQKPASGFTSVKSKTKIPGMGADNGLHHSITASDGKGTKGKYSTIESKP